MSRKRFELLRTFGNFISFLFTKRKIKINLYEMKFQNYFLVTQTSKKCFEPTLKVIHYAKYNLKKN